MALADLRRLIVHVVYRFDTGATLGGIVGYATYTEPKRTCGPDSLFCGGFGLDQSAAAVQGVAVGGVLGGAVGFLLGSRRQDRWTAMRTAEGPGRLTIAPARGGIALDASLPF